MQERELIEQMLPDAMALVRRYHRDRAGLHIKIKSNPVDLVTQADVETQHLIAGRIAEHFPDDVIVGEEAGHDRAPDDRDARCWVIDPIDGTHNFARGLLPAFGVSIAFAEGGTPRAAGIGLPYSDDIFIADTDSQTTRNGAPVHVSDIDTLDACKMGFDFARLSHRDMAVDASVDIMRKVGQVRALGATVVGMCAVAEGSFDGYMHMSIHPWDYAAGLLLVTQAGGRASRSDGSDIHLFDGRRDILVTNGQLHDVLLGCVG
jgi:myo-inositol-1(or 4)-monophosphatase